jgi:hypothetical protein
LSLLSLASGCYERDNAMTQHSVGEQMLEVSGSR